MIDKKTCEIALFGRIPLPMLLAEHKLSPYTIIDITVGNDQCIHLLLAETVPERERGMFVPTTSNTHYQALTLIVDWQSGELLLSERTDFGHLIPNLHFIQRLGDGFLLLGARCRRYDDGRTEKYGWDQPLGHCGVVLWSAQGQVLWQNEQHDIWDCYAMNLDAQDQLWFYYYGDFLLVKTNYQTYQEFDPKLSGSSCFLLHAYGSAILFDAGYQKHGQFICKTLAGDHLVESTDAHFTYAGQRIPPRSYSFHGSKALLCDEQQNLYFTDWHIM